MVRVRLLSRSTGTLADWASTMGASSRPRKPQVRAFFKDSRKVSRQRDATER